MHSLFSLFTLATLVLGDAYAFNSTIDDEAEAATPTVAGGSWNTIQGRLQYPDKSPFNMTTKVTLNHGEFTTYCKVEQGCTFEFSHLPAGVHQLDVHSTTHHFAHYKIQILPPKDNRDDAVNAVQPKILEYSFVGANKQIVSAYPPLQVTAYATLDYFEVRRGFSVWHILKNPMVLMMAFSVGMMFLMPKMMEGLDPEEKAQMKKQMEIQQDPSKMLNSLWEGLGGGEEQSAPQARVVKKSGTTGGGGTRK